MLKKINFFSKEKDLILKVTNAVLIIWFLVACTFLYSSISNVVYKTEVETFETYQSRYCYYEEDEEEIERCENDYHNHLYFNDNSKYNNNKQILMSFVNILIVTSVMLLLNRKEEKK